MFLSLKCKIEKLRYKNVLIYKKRKVSTLNKIVELSHSHKKMRIEAKLTI